MIQLLRHRLALVPLAALLVALVALPHPVLAQFYDESLEDEEFFEEDEEFFEAPPGQQFGVPAPEEDFTEGDRYVEESNLPPSERGVPGTAQGRALQLRLSGERELLPLNAAWGAGTGLLIGGWFALINQGNNRETQRAIGMGIVLGTVLGVVVGVRTLIDPNAPGTAQNETAPPDADGGSDFLPLVSLDRDSPRVGFRMAF